MNCCVIRAIGTQSVSDPLGPYSQFVSSGDIVFISGQVPIIPNTIIIPDSIYDQTYQTLQNIRDILDSQELSMSNIVKTTLFVKSIEDLEEINRSYEKFFYVYCHQYINNRIRFPARSCVEVSRLPKDVKIEIDAIAIRHF